jgi:para-aminobenzoate synthetase component 1
MDSAPSLDALFQAAQGLAGFGCFDVGEKQTVLTWGEGTPHTVSDGWQAFVRRNLRPSSTDARVFSGGVIGWLGYEAGRSVETMPDQQQPRPTHDVCLWRTDGAITIHQDTATTSIDGTEAFKAQARALLEAAASLESRTVPLSPADPWAPPNPEARARRFTAGVDQVLEHVRRGDVYQVNLAWEQAQLPVADASRTWLRLRGANPATRGCFLRQGDVEIVSNSPELFLEVEPSSRQMRSAPIKGTAPRASGEAGRQALQFSPKERAELTMIVDLVRNDLGRIASPGTVQAGPRTLRECGDLWHAEQTVQASLAPEHDAVDAVAAAFPPGSVTGAPKVRAMQVIHTLEERPRGVYTGALGFFSDAGGVHLNVAIRTATVIDGKARFHVGAGIVADSQPELEWNETLDKARALANSLRPEAQP